MDYTVWVKGLGSRVKLLPPNPLGFGCVLPPIMENHVRETIADEMVGVIGIRVA